MTSKVSKIVSPKKAKKVEANVEVKAQNYESNQAIIDEFFVFSSKNDKLIEKLQTERTVKYPHYYFNTKLADTSNIPPEFSVMEIMIEKSSLLRLKEWVATKKPSITALPVDIFNLKTDFTVYNLEDLIRLNKAQQGEVQRYAFFGESPACKASLLILLRNAKVINYHLQQATLLTEDAASSKEECDAIIEEMHDMFERFKLYDMQWKGDAHLLMHQLGLNESYMYQLKNMLLPAFPSKSVESLNLSLTYQATRHGFNATDFHKYCDNKSYILALVKSASGFVFGGFTTACFNSNVGNSHIATNDGNSFLFTLTNPHNIPPTKLPISQGSNTIYYKTDYSLTFGSGHDLHICNNANTVASSYSAFNAYPDPTGKGETLFTGQRNLGTIDEILVFVVTA